MNQSKFVIFILINRLIFVYFVISTKQKKKASVVRETRVIRQFEFEYSIYTQGVFILATHSHKSRKCNGLQP